MLALGEFFDTIGGYAALGAILFFVQWYFGKIKKMLDWKTKQVNDIPTNPLDCYWAVGKVGTSTRLYTIVEQRPADTTGKVLSNVPELYVLFEALGGRCVADVFTTEKELKEWKYASIWGNYWFKTRGSFVHAYKTLDEAKARAETQISHIQNLIDIYFPSKKTEEKENN